MYCDKCGTLIDDNASFCFECGNKLDNTDSVPTSEGRAPDLQAEPSGPMTICGGPTKRDLHRMSGPVFLMILGGFLISLFPIVFFDNIEEIIWGVISLINGLAAMTGGLFTFFSFKKHNDAVMSKLKGQYCVTKCGKCHTSVCYTGTDPVLSIRWRNGYVYCPVCNTPIAHAVKNIKSTGCGKT